MWLFETSCGRGILAFCLCCILLLGSFASSRFGSSLLGASHVLSGILLFMEMATSISKMSKIAITTDSAPVHSDIGDCACCKIRGALIGMGKS